MILTYFQKYFHLSILNADNQNKVLRKTFFSRNLQTFSPTRVELVCSILRIAVPTLSKAPSVSEILILHYFIFLMPLNPFSVISLSHIIRPSSAFSLDVLVPLSNLCRRRRPELTFQS